VAGGDRHYQQTRLIKPWQQASIKTRRLARGLAFHLSRYFSGWKTTARSFTNNAFTARSVGVNRSKRFYMLLPKLGPITFATLPGASCVLNEAASTTGRIVTA